MAAYSNNYPCFLVVNFQVSWKKFLVCGILQILTVITPNVVDVWEAALTLLFFVILVFLSYLSDIKIWKKETPRLETELKEITCEKATLSSDPNADVIIAYKSSSGSLSL